MAPSGSTIRNRSTSDADQAISTWPMIQFEPQAGFGDRCEVNAGRACHRTILDHAAGPGRRASKPMKLFDGTRMIGRWAELGEAFNTRGIRRRGSLQIDSDSEGYAAHLVVI